MYKEIHTHTRGLNTYDLQLLGRQDWSRVAAPELQKLDVAGHDCGSRRDSSLEIPCANGWEN